MVSSAKRWMAFLSSCRDLEHATFVGRQLLDDYGGGFGIDARQFDGKHAGAELLEGDAAGSAPTTEIGDAQLTQRPLADGNALGLEFAHGAHARAADHPDRRRDQRDDAGEPQRE